MVFFFFLILRDVINETIIPLALAGHEMSRVNSTPLASLAVYHCISNAFLWDDCSLDYAFEISCLI